MKCCEVRSPGGEATLLTLHEVNVPLFGLTNWSAETFPYARKHYPFLSCFRDIVVSGEVKQIKPDEAICRTSFGHISAYLPGVQPEEVVFVDDVLGNVEAAIALGWQGIHHISAEYTRERLAALDLSF